MNVFEFAHHILKHGDIASKLISPKSVTDFSGNPKPFLYEEPTRDLKFQFSDDKMKFPGRGSLKDIKQRAKALHFFANHELLAIEMMAFAILAFPEMTNKQRKIMLSTIGDEQKHFSMYCSRMEQFGIGFGDFPLNQFFWKFTPLMGSLDEFYAIVALTFEQANLDFAKHYQSVFKEVGDEETAQIIKEVYEDEIKHVARGKVELERSIEDPEELWTYYESLLPTNLTAERGKGIHFDQEGRVKSGLPIHFIESVKNYRSGFKVTNRRQWKN